MDSRHLTLGQGGVGGVWGMDSRHLTLGRAPRDPSNSHLGGASVPPRGTVAFLFSNILASLASCQLDLTLGQGGVGGKECVGNGFLTPALG